MPTLPRISFGIIVLNGEPFTRYCLRALYPFAYEIIVVEGASRNAATMATPDGHSIDGTLGVLQAFKAEEDPHDRIQIVTRDGFWTEKDEQSQAYADRATGDYLWQVDIDEFYLEATLQHVSDLLIEQPEIAMVSFPVTTFWGGFNFTVDGFHEQEFTIRERGWPRLFKWGKGYRYITHRPPTVVDAAGVDLRQKRWIDHREAASLGLQLMHYSLVFPLQVEAKVAYHGRINPSTLSRRQMWADNFRTLANPFQPASDGSVKHDISWLERYDGRHPKAIEELRSDIASGAIHVEQRQTEDVNRLLQSFAYRLIVRSLKRIAPPLIRSKIQIRRAGRLVRRIARGVEVVFTGTLPTYVRQVLIKSPSFAHRYSLQILAERSRPDWPDFARSFFVWHTDEIRPRLQHHAIKSWATIVPEPELPAVAGKVEAEASLLVAARGFFQSAEAGLTKLSESYTQLQIGGRLLIYAPHPQIFDGWSDYRWCPTWQEIVDWARGEGAEIVEYNTTFDRNGFFYVVIEKRSNVAKPISLVEVETLKKYRFHFFYLQQGGNRTIGHSARVLSAAAYRVLEQYGTLVAEYSYMTAIESLRDLRPGDICMGHFGPWIVDAKRAGCHTILYGPSDRFQKERTDLFHGEPFYQRLQARGNFDAQYAASDMGIFQGGSRWRSEDMWTYSGLCRWVDIPVSPTVFPRSKHRFAPPGQRKFVFINLWDEHQKGAETAKRIAQACPDYEFSVIAGIPIHLPNCRNYTWIGSTTPRYRRLISQADFVVCPGREDPQPGTVAEACSLGLLPILSYGSGYVLSFPQMLDVDNIDQCVSVLKAAQQASAEEIALWQTISARYIEAYHRPDYFENLLLYYLREAITEIKSHQV